MSFQFDLAVSISLTIAFSIPTNLDDSIDLLDRFIRMTPSLKALDIGGNHFQDLPPSLVDTILSHPRLDYLGLSDSLLGCIRHRPTPCVINQLLSRLCTAASSSPLSLYSLDLGSTNMTAECCGPVLENLLALGSRGLGSLNLETNSFLKSHGRTLARIILNDNFTIKECSIDGLCDYDSDDEEVFYDNENSQLLKSALERNREVAKKTQEVACGIVKVGRIILLGAAGSSSASPVLDEPLVRFRLLDLPPELQQLVLPFVYPGALSDRQVFSVFRYAADRTTLLPRTLYTERDAFLNEMGCDRYDTIDQGA